MNGLGWILIHWRLKLLAVGMSVGLLGVAAFAQNPLQIRSITASIRYENLDPSLVLVRPPSTLGIPVTGLGTDVAGLGPTNVSVVVDLSRAKKGKAVSVVGIPRIPISGVSAQVDRIQMTLFIDDRVTRTLDVEVRPTNVNPAWIVDTDLATPNKVTVTGPASELERLKALARYDQRVESARIQLVSWPVTFERDGKQDDFAGVRNTISIDPTTVALEITAHQPKVTRFVYLSPNWTGALPSGLSLKSIVADPALIQIQGPPDVIGKTDVLQLSPVSLDGLAAGDNQKLKVTVVQLPSNVELVQAPALSVNVSVASLPLPSSPSSPAPSPRPSPSPAPTPT